MMMSNIEILLKEWIELAKEAMNSKVSKEEFKEFLKDREEANK